MALSDAYMQINAVTGDCSCVQQNKQKKKACVQRVYLADTDEL